MKSLKLFLHSFFRICDSVIQSITGSFQDAQAKYNFDYARNQTKLVEMAKAKFRYYKPIESKDWAGDPKVVWQLRDLPLTQEQVELFNGLDWNLYTRFLS